MGIQIRLFVDTDRISEESRKKVYDESLLLLDAYPFMDEIWDYERFANRKEEEEDRVNLAIKSREVFGSIWIGLRIGIYLKSDRKAGLCSET